MPVALYCFAINRNSIMQDENEITQVNSLGYLQSLLMLIALISRC